MTDPKLNVTRVTLYGKVTSEPLRETPKQSSDQITKIVWTIENEQDQRSIVQT